MAAHDVNGDRLRLKRTAGAALALFGVGMLAVQWHRLRLAAAACAAEMTRMTHSPQAADGRRRILILGDSTGVGIGALRPQDTMAGHLASALPGTCIVNAAACGARVADLTGQWSLHGAGQVWDAVLVHAGGNDVIRGTSLRLVEHGVRQLARDLGDQCTSTVWLGPANVGGAPLFLPPLSWWMASRTRRICSTLASACGSAGIGFLRFDQDTSFAADRALYFATDGIHPSAAAYSYCAGRLKESHELWRRVAAHRVPAVPAT